MLEQRRLQKLGKSTLMVSLPKEWADRLNLKKGGVVNLTTDELGRLIVHPSLEMVPTKTRCIINVDRVDDTLLGRLMLGAYIAGHEIIEIRTKTVFTTAQLETVRETLNELIGVGIVEQQDRRVVIQSFLDPSKFPIDGLISRLYLIVESMMDLAVRALIEEKNELAKQVLDMDVEADKVYFLAIRQILQAVGDKGLAEKVGLANPKNILGDRLVLKALEEIGDFSQVVARSVMKINDLGYHSRDINDIILQLRERAKKIAVMSMSALSKGDPKSANSAIIEYESLVELEEKLGSELEGRMVSATTAVTGEFKSITQGILQIGRYYMIAAETMINRAAEGSTEMTEVIKVSEA